MAVEKEKLAEFSERFLYHIWDARHLEGDLQTVSGKKLKIISPGRLSNSAGPDFREAVLSIDNDIVRGDVEIHKTTYDWKAHNHSEDINYCNVILHVVYEHNTWQEVTIDKEGKKIEIFELKNYLDDDIKRIFSKYNKRPEIPEEKFCRFFAAQPAATITALLSLFGLERLAEKEKRFTAELYFNGFNQLAYQGILEALGYANNKFQMLQLANTLSYEDIRKWYQEGLQEEELIAVWLGSTGLFEHFPLSFPGEFVLKWKEIYAAQSYYTGKISTGWYLFRLRPVNNPAIRLLQAAPLIYKSLAGSLFQELVRLFSYPSGKLSRQDFYKRLSKLFCAESDYLPRKWWLGRTRIDIIFINIILPLVRLYARRNNYTELEETSLDVFKNYRRLPGNNLTRAMERYMDSSQIKESSRKAVYQQGLLHIYHSWCKNYNCEDCCKERDIKLKQL